MIDQSIITKNELEYRLKTANEEGYEWQERRHDDWRENYTLSRDKVITNRLTQRQSVNIPLMKQILKTILSKIDDFVDLEFTNLDNDKQRELFYNTYWNDVVKDDNSLELKDMVDKKQVLTFGRSFEKLNVVNGKIKFHIVHPQDMRVDRFLDPTDLDSARYVIQGNIFSTLSDLKLNDSYDQSVIDELETFYATEAGLIKSSEDAEKWREKNQMMRDMGSTDVDDPQVGQTVIQMQEGFIKVWNPKTEDEEIILTVTANSKLVYAEFLETIIGETADHYWRSHYPFESWAEDLDNNDFWCDGVADSVRVPNKIVNAWFSQMVENRTLTNLGMNYYNSTVGGEDGDFIPQTFEPAAFGWYPVPGNPNEIIKRIDIPPLDGNLEEINFVVQIAEKASAATAITQGVSEQRKITLGEVELLAGNAMDRIQSMSLFYRKAWLKLGKKYVKLVEAMGDELEAVKIYKKGYRGNVFSKEIAPKDWHAENGYSVEVISKKDKAERDLEQIQKLSAVRSQFPTNVAMTEIYNKKLLDLGGLSPDEVKRIMDEERKRTEDAMKNPAMLPPSNTPTLMPNNPTPAIA